MAHFKCDKHGSQGAVLVCPHVRIAIDENAKIEAFTVKDKAYIVEASICFDCRQLFQTIRNNEAYEAFVDTLQPVCEMCFEENQRMK